MAKVLIQFAHPLLEKSRVQKQLLKQATQVKGITINDLYEHYPNFDIDIEREKQLLLSHDVIIFQHPLYWYSTPAIIKQWLDLVLEHGWAYGKGGSFLKGKIMLNALSCGGSKDAYKKDGKNRFTIPQLLAPLEQTARLCNMHFAAPYIVFGTHKLTDDEIGEYGLQYAQILHAIQTDKVKESDWMEIESLNELCPIPAVFQN